MKLRSFGCSFIYGSELEDRSNTWPGIIAKKLNVEHDNHGIEGAGNLRILECVLDHAALDSLCVINWTWIDRFDYVTLPGEHWNTIVPADTDTAAVFYYRNLHSQYRDMLTNLLYVKCVIDFLQQNKIKFLMTFMDKLLLDPVRPDWHAAQTVSQLQNFVKPHLHLFHNLTFLEWSRAHNFEESAMWHPLDQAHAAAADVMLDPIHKIIGMNKCQNAS